jgi:hypothetical protein
MLRSLFLVACAIILPLASVVLLDAGETTPAPLAPSDEGCLPDRNIPPIALHPRGLPSPPPLETRRPTSILDAGLTADRSITVDPNDEILSKLAPQFGESNREANASEPIRVSRRPERSTPRPVTISDSDRAKLQAKVERALEIYRHKHLNSGETSPWGIMHAVVPFGTESMIRIGGPQGELRTAIGWLCFNQRCRGLNLFYPTRDGFALKSGPGYQGHEGQLLAILAQSNLQRDYPIRVEDEKYTIEDLIEHEQQTCRARTELTFKLIGLSHYLDTDATWTSDDGDEWSIPRLIAEEIVQPIRGAACGGTHRLFGLNYAVHRRRHEGKPIDGQYERARKYIADYQAYALKMQNSDGSFSTEWFRGPGDQHDDDRKIKTTGHILEWLVFSLPVERLESPEIARATNRLADLLVAGRNRKLEVGPQGHAVHALVLYHQRVFASAPQREEKPTSEPIATARRVDRPVVSAEQHDPPSRKSARPLVERGESPAASEDGPILWAP